MTPRFSTAFREDLARLMAWRRDVRRFRPDPVPGDVLDRGLAAFATAPSVGLSEPWRVVAVDSAAARAAALANFEGANAEALAEYHAGGELSRAAIYAGLKLSGMRDAPVQLAVFCDEATPKGAGLGARTMPEMRAYSVVSAVTLLWLALRAEGVGLGWVSILDPERLTRDLDVPASWRLIGYFCIGYPETESATPELEQLGWEPRLGLPEMEQR
ncbi:5,6-dimethylbenzimidazole synthase [Pseudothioclava arenosa]|uniref:5,6-dimethylbenzimidazole synthase n=1 Tax=Pseudothioclava arenosa TaxID=1795308 RepID=A0A2A4CJ17_9RHOB|nr:5,6-dimethylbenzimidazole synthase [Pseudothioclava arenosa]PCD76033.1 5,6-dimethylbenzimidazole synthase [Pseudothioclava arenosa]